MPRTAMEQAQYILSTARDLESASMQSYQEGLMADLLSALNEADQMLAAGKPAATSESDWNYLIKASAHGNYVVEAISDWTEDGAMSFKVAGQEDRGEVVQFDPAKPAAYWVQLEEQDRNQPKPGAASGMSPLVYVGIFLVVGAGTLYLFGKKGKK